MPRLHIQTKMFIWCSSGSWITVSVIKLGLMFTVDNPTKLKWLFNFTCSLIQSAKLSVANIMSLFITKVITFIYSASPLLKKYIFFVFLKHPKSIGCYSYFLTRNEYFLFSKNALSWSQYKKQSKDKIKSKCCSFKSYIIKNYTKILSKTTISNLDNEKKC